MLLWPVQGRAAGAAVMMTAIHRRALVATLGGAAAAALLRPFAAHAQQPAKLPTIGFLNPTSEATNREIIAAFVQRLRELGWIDGSTVKIEYRWADGSTDRLAQIAAELVQLKVNVIVTGGTPAVAAAKQATTVIPIVMNASGDPLGTGLVDSLSHPGGNVTGMSMQNTDIGTKRLELLRETVPGLHRLAILANVDFPDAVIDLHQIQAAATGFGLDVTALEIRRTPDISPALATLKDRADALYVCGDPLVTDNRLRIVTLALGLRLPTIYNFRQHVDAGGLMSYGPSMAALYRRSADIVDKILRGAKPADIPVEQPTTFDLVVNLITAQALGITVPPTIIARATDVIE